MNDVRKKKAVIAVDNLILWKRFRMNGKPPIFWTTKLVLTIRIVMCITVETGSFWEERSISNKYRVIHIHQLMVLRRDSLHRLRSALYALGDHYEGKKKGIIEYL